MRTGFIWPTRSTYGGILLKPSPHPTFPFYFPSLIFRLRCSTLLLALVLLLPTGYDFLLLRWIMFLWFVILWCLLLVSKFTRLTLLWTLPTQAGGLLAELEGVLLGKFIRAIALGTISCVGLMCQRIYFQEDLFWKFCTTLFYVILTN